MRLKAVTKNGYKNRFKTTGELFVNTEYKCLFGDSKVTVKDNNNKLLTLTLEELYLLEQEKLIG